MKPGGEHERLWPDAGRLIDMSDMYGTIGGIAYQDLGDRIALAGYGWRLWRDQDSLACWGCLDKGYGDVPYVVISRYSVSDVLTELATMAERWNARDMALFGAWDGVL